MTDILQGAKTIEILGKTTYPIVSAYEFEFLKEEEEIQALLKPCTIYFILQRPLLTFSNFVSGEGVISFEITDDRNTAPLRCKFDPAQNGLCEPDEQLLIEANFYKKVKPKEQPFDGLAGFRILSADRKFLAWFGPQKFLYECIARDLKAEITGDVNDYIDYHVHYIGKAFSQDIWKRLTGHHKMQRILTMEDALNTEQLKAPFEISLLMLDIDGFREMNMFPYNEALLRLEAEPILFDIPLDDEEALVSFNTPLLETGSEELTTEVEAMLVNLFRPSYNEVLFENYPHIKNGTRDAGYSEASLMIERLPAILSTPFHKQHAV